MIPPMQRTLSLSKLPTNYMLRWGIKVILKIEVRRSKIKINLKRSPLVIFSPKRSRSLVVILKIKIKDRDLAHFWSLSFLILSIKRHRRSKDWVCLWYSVLRKPIYIFPCFATSNVICITSVASLSKCDNFFC